MRRGSVLFGVEVPGLGIGRPRFVRIHTILGHDPQSLSDNYIYIKDYQCQRQNSRTETSDFLYQQYCFMLHVLLFQRKNLIIII